MAAEELIGIDIKAYVTKDTLEAMKNEIKYHGSMSARLVQTDKEIKMVWIEEK
jgi:hypothetical protein